MSNTHLAIQELHAWVRKHRKHMGPQLIAGQLVGFVIRILKEHGYGKDQFMIDMGAAWDTAESAGNTTPIIKA